LIKHRFLGLAGCAALCDKHLTAKESIMELIGQTFKTTIYESVIGKVIIENEILLDGSVSATMWVVYPDGFGDEVFSIGDAYKMLEL
jgi:hypothetical protein